MANVKLNLILLTNKNRPLSFIIIWKYLNKKLYKRKQRVLNRLVIKIIVYASGAPNENQMREGWRAIDLSPWSNNLFLFLIFIICVNLRFIHIVCGFACHLIIFSEWQFDPGTTTKFNLILTKWIVQTET